MEKWYVEKHPEQVRDLYLISIIRDPANPSFKRDDAFEELMYWHFDTITLAYVIPNQLPGQSEKQARIRGFTQEDYRDLFSVITFCFYELVLNYQESKGLFANYIRSTLRFKVFNSFYEGEVTELIMARSQELHEWYSYDFEGSKATDYNLSDVYVQALEELTVKQRVVFMRSVLDGWSNREIADDLQCSPSTIANTLKKAKKKVQSSLLSGESVI